MAISVILSSCFCATSFNLSSAYVLKLEKHKKKSDRKKTKTKQKKMNGVQFSEWWEGIDKGCWKKIAGGWKEEGGGYLKVRILKKLFSVNLAHSCFGIKSVYFIGAGNEFNSTKNTSISL
jgi:hypothetical protein